jgi:two-component system, cell cycle response regulator
MTAVSPAASRRSGLAQAPDESNSVLIAEDDPVSRRLLEISLKKWNYRVVVVENGLDAWNALQEKNAPQIAILDWMMPAVDGPGLCRRLRAQSTGGYLYLLLVTAKASKEDVVEGLEAGADDYLTKPFNADELCARIRAGERILRLEQALRRTRDALQFEAAHDPLTGLWNHGAILELLQRETQRNRRTADPVGVMMADLDHFKKVNDTYGHPVGDVVLRECAHRMVAEFRDYDWVGRYGGEEFLIVVPGCTGADLAATAERLRCCIAGRPIETAAGPIPVTVSVGVVSGQFFQHPNPDYAALLSAADQALYQAKAQGRNQVEVRFLEQAAEPR